MKHLGQMEEVLWNDRDLAERAESLFDYALCARGELARSIQLPDVFSMTFEETSQFGRHVEEVCFSFSLILNV